MSIMKKSLVALAIVVPTILVQTASAMTWETKTINETFEQLHAPTSDTSSVAIFCSKGKLKSAISVASSDAGNIVDSMSESRRKKTVEVDLYVGGEKVNSSPWSYSHRQKIFIPRSSRVAVKLYNAAVKGDSVSFKRTSRDMVELTMPAPNGDFVSFGGDCGIGNSATN